jgi:hypothetical protein
VGGSGPLPRSRDRFEIGRIRTQTGRGVCLRHSWQAYFLVLNAAAGEKGDVAARKAAGAEIRKMMKEDGIADPARLQQACSRPHPCR